MGRQALLVANSVTYLETQKGIRRGTVARTIDQLADVLENLPNEFAFQTSKAVDQSPEQVRQKLEAAARRAHSSNSLLLFYYFGHGALTKDFQLQFVHPGGRRLKFSNVGSVFELTDCEKSISLIDCCYAAAGYEKFQSLGEGHCLLAATTPTARAYIGTSSDEPPIGEFTLSILDGFFDRDACVSMEDSRITAQSLFDYASAATRKRTSEIQKPYMSGTLAEPLSRYVPRPSIIPSVTEWANDKSTYVKLMAIVQLLANEHFPTERAFYRRLLKKYHSSFITLFKKDNKIDGDQGYRPIEWETVSRYVSFLRSLQIVDGGSFRLMPVGRNLLSDGRKRYNEKLLIQIDDYLEKHGLTRTIIDEALRSLLARRRMPSRTDIFDVFSLAGHSISTWELGLILDLMGYIGAIRMSTQRVYYPW